MFIQHFVNMIIRDDALVMPRGDTKIIEGDILYILADKNSIKPLKQYLNED